MKQNNLSIDFKLAVVNSNSYVFNFNVQHSIHTATEIMIQNFGGKKSVPAYYIPDSQRLMPIGIDGYWTVSHYTLTFTATPPGGDISELEERVTTIESALRGVSSDVEKLVDDVDAINDTLPELTGRVDTIVSYLSSAYMYREASGNPAIFSDAAADTFKKVSAAIAFTQSGSGDPYPPGSGKNLLDVSAFSSTNSISVTASDVSDGSINAKALITSTEYMDIRYEMAIPAGRYILSGNITSSNASAVPRILIANKIGGGTIAAISNTVSSYTFNVSNDIEAYVILRMDQGKNVSANDTVAAIYLMLRLSGTSDDFEPYSNIRPITGASSVAVTRTGENGANSQTVTVTLTDGSNPLTVYGGTLDIITGSLIVTWGNIASYNGETLPGRWVSDRDVYAPGATPTTGAHVVYELATPVTYQITPAQLAALPGYNAVTSDTGNVSVMYLSDGSLYFI